MRTTHGPMSGHASRDEGFGVAEGTLDDGAIGPGRGFEGAHDHEHANDHYALVYETEAELFSAVVPFVREGLAAGEHCLYVLDDRPEAAVAEALREGGVDVDAAREAGMLTFHTVGETYLRQEPFDPDGMVEFYADAVESALEEHAGLRVVAGTNWIADVSIQDFMEYEGRVNRLFDRTDSAALCLYDRNALPPSVIEDVIRTHPHLVFEGAVCENFYYVPPDELFESEGSAREVDRLLGTLRDRTSAEAELAEHKQFLQELNEVTSSPNRSFEGKLHDLFDLGCAWFDLELGALNRVDPEADRLEVEYINGDHDYYTPGAAFPLSETYCVAAADIKDAASVVDPPEEGFDDLAVYQEFGVQSYLGTYIPVEGGDDRTFAFIAPGSRAEPFSEEDLSYLRLMGQWVKYELEREEREAELQESKDHFEQIFESSHDAIFIVDPEADEIVDANPAASEMLGYAREELLSLGPSDLHPDELDTFREFVNGVIDDGSGWTDELTCRTKDRGTIPAEISASRLQRDDHPVVLAAVRDISERKERERSQRRLYEIAADTDHTLDEKLPDVFELGRELFELEVGGMAKVDVEADYFEVETIHGEHEHLVPGEQYPLSETYCREVTEDGEIFCVTDPVDRGFGGKLCYDEFGVRTYLGTYLGIDGDDDRTFFFLSNDRREEPFSETERTFHHLMGQWVKFELERERYERELEETVERLRQSNDRLKQFAYAASHDLQEPLRMVSSYLQLLENEHADDLDAEAVEFLGFAVDGADRMRSMVDDLLAYSRVEQSDGEFARVDCDDVLDRVLDDLQVPIEEADATVDVEALPTVRADAEQLEQLFRNLLSNAIKYGGESPVHVEVTVEEQSDGWTFAVTDDGIGIDPEKTDRIFEVFKRLHHDDEYSGTGIGLSLCQEIVDNHGGDIGVESEPGEGSTFHFTVPKRP